MIEEVTVMELIAGVVVVHVKMMDPGQVVAVLELGDQVVDPGVIENSANKRNGVVREVVVETEIETCPHLDVALHQEIEMTGEMLVHGEDQVQVLTGHLSEEMTDVMIGEMRDLVMVAEVVAGTLVTVIVALMMDPEELQDANLLIEVAGDVMDLQEIVIEASEIEIGDSLLDAGDLQLEMMDLVIGAVLQEMMIAKVAVDLIAVVMIAVVQ